MTSGTRWRIARGGVIMAGMSGRLVAVTFAVIAGSFAIAGSSAGGAAGSAAVREKAASWAVSQNGLREVGASNCGSQINRWQRQMGLKVPPCRVWCGAFVHQAFRRAGVQLSARLIDPHRSYYDAIAGRNGLRKVATGAIRRGDLVFYNFREGAGLKASHVGIARDRPRDGSLATVEGNTAQAVRLEVRGMQYIVLAARVTGDA